MGSTDTISVSLYESEWREVMAILGSSHTTKGVNLAAKGIAMTAIRTAIMAKGLPDPSSRVDRPYSKRLASLLASTKMAQDLWEWLHTIREIDTDPNWPRRLNRSAERNRLYGQVVRVLDRYLTGEWSLYTASDAGYGVEFAGEWMML